MNEIILHGECMIFRSLLPDGAVKKNVGSVLKIADSETTGNDHVVDIGPNDKVYEYGGVVFLENKDPTQVRCLHQARHDSVELDPGVWEFGIQQEYDYFTESLRKVRD